MIKPEAALLNILILQEYYNKYRNFIVLKDDKELQTLYNLLDKAMETYQRDLSYEEYSYYVLSNITYDKDVIEALLGIIHTTNIQPDLAETLLIQYKERTLAHAIALTAIAVTEGKTPFSELADKLDDAAVPQVVEEDEFVSTDLGELYENQVKKHGLRWRLNTLNRMFGSLRKGDFGFIFARPETGKTTFLANEITFFAEQLTMEHGPILWFNNEEDGKKVQLRIFQAALGVTLQDLFKDVKVSNETYHTLTRNKIKVIDSANISKQQVESLCKKLSPSCIIFDQLDKVKGFTGDREDLRLGTVYQWARELAKTYCPVVAVCQADGTAEGKKWLTMENVANAKTAKQAEADWILGIGATHQDGFEFIRHLHASKNKLTGDEDSDPKMRHGKADVVIDPERARYKDYA
jgi:KaiC/GvpD/RAD55 family RecA-like ATPase